MVRLLRKNETYGFLVRYSFAVSDSYIICMPDKSHSFFKFSPALFARKSLIDHGARDDDSMMWITTFKPDTILLSHSSNNGK
jgi:hypothetical protein